MKIALVGVGSIGKKYASFVSSPANVLVAIDPKFKTHVSSGQFSSIYEAVSAEKSIDVWAVTSPTEVHLQNIKEILSFNPNAKILVEKPVCLPHQATELSEILSKYKNASLMVNDIYKQSPTVKLYKSVLEKITSNNNAIKSISIEFTKNRSKDNYMGRFQDQHYGVVGYEGFHIFSLLQVVLPTEEFKSIIQSPSFQNFNDDGDFLYAKTLTSGLEVNLASSMKGNILLESAFHNLYSKVDVKKMIYQKKISFASEFRYRFVEVVFTNGDIATLVFESNYGNNELDYKNIHEVITYSNGEIKVVEIHANHLQEVFMKQLETLFLSQSPIVSIEKDIHRKLSAIAKTFTPSEEIAETKVNFKKGYSYAI